jgi:hypothetical protein
MLAMSVCTPALNVSLGLLGILIQRFDDWVRYRKVEPLGWSRLRVPLTIDALPVQPVAAWQAGGI